MLLRYCSHHPIFPNKFLCNSTDQKQTQRQSQDRGQDRGRWCVLMHDAVGNVVNQDLHSFLYDADTFGGSSGSPVFINDESFIIYGIHVRGFDETDTDTSNDFNSATKISPLIYTVATILKFNE